MFSEIITSAIVKMLKIDAWKAILQVFVLCDSPLDLKNDLIRYSAM